MKYAIFIDIDGTLLSDNQTISNRCKNIIENIVSIGHYVILCTARYRNYAIELSQDIGASNYVLTSNGAELYDYKKNKVIFSNTILPETVITILNKVTESNLKATLAIDDAEYIIGKKYNNLQRYIPNEYENFFEGKSTKQFMIIDDDKNNIDSFRNFVNNFENITITNKHTIKEEQGNWFSFVQKETSKGTGISKFSELFSIPKDNIIAIGNDYNDIPMFENSGISIAVKNATNDILEMVDIITDTNNEDGVAKALERLYISKL